MTRKAAAARRMRAPPVMDRAIPMPLEPFWTEAWAVEALSGAAAFLSPFGLAEEPLAPPVSALLGGTSCPTGVTLPSAWKPQSRRRAVSW